MWGGGKGVIGRAVGGTYFTGGWARWVGVGMPFYFILFYLVVRWGYTPMEQGGACRATPWTAGREIPNTFKEETPFELRMCYVILGPYLIKTCSS